MREGDPEFEALRDAIAELAAGSAPALVAEARAEAFARVRALLTDAIAHELLGRARSLIAGEAPGPAPPKKPKAQKTEPRRRPHRVKETPVAPPQDEPALGCYVYGITLETSGESDQDRPAGVDGRYRIRQITGGGLTALVSDVDLSEFGEEPLVENLNDVEWLERMARTHEQVLEWAMDRATVVPMRLCTIYNGEAQVLEMLGRERGALREALERLTGKSEWGVKVIATPGALHDSLEADEGAAPDLSPGTAYIEARRREARAKERLDELAEGWAIRVHERLAVVAFEALRNPPQAPGVAGYDGEMLLNGVYLVEYRAVESFREVVDVLASELGQHGVEVELTGPWPAYNFVKSSIEAAR